MLVVNIQMCFHLIILLYPQVLLSKWMTWAIFTPSEVSPLHSTSSLSAHLLGKDGVVIATPSSTLQSSLPLAPCLPGPPLPWEIYFFNFMTHMDKEQEEQFMPHHAKPWVSAGKLTRTNMVTMSSYSPTGMHVRITHDSRVRVPGPGSRLTDLDLLGIQSRNPDWISFTNSGNH